MISKIVTIDEFNRDAESRYQTALKSWADIGGGFPARSMYFFYSTHGEVKRKGWVLVAGKGYRWFPNKRDAVKVQEAL